MMEQRILFQISTQDVLAIADDLNETELETVYKAVENYDSDDFFYFLNDIIAQVKEARTCIRSISTTTSTTSVKST